MFGSFGNALGDALGLTVVKFGDNKSAVGKHLDKVKKGLENTKNKLKELSGKISETKNADTKGVEDAIKNSSGVFEKLIESVTKLVGATSGDTDDIGHNAAPAAAPANRDNVEAFISGVKEIIKTATASGVKIEDSKGKEGSPVEKILILQLLCLVALL
ncbi:variable large family protein [Borrelia coriaceae]|uniref:variable large family protein n=1 Tax=Borrelia coriaceae TaxID=144 RepID=UPI002410741C|nr:variable large family protein [Borrelia coriaceae]